MKYDLWEPKRRIENSYKRELLLLTRQIFEAVGQTDNPSIILQRLKLLAQTPQYQKFAEAAALKMVTQVFTDAGRTWRQAALVNSKGREMYQAIMAELKNPGISYAIRQKFAENAQLIKSLPLGLADDATQQIADLTLQGLRPKAVAEAMLQKLPVLSESRIQLIARTEVSKTNTALTQARSQSLGLDWYIWRTSRDARVRRSHDTMDMVLVNWSEPPSPESLAGEKPYGNYHAGDTFNCRCYAQPVVNLDRVTWPAKVYTDGQIVTMTRAQFETGNKVAPHTGAWIETTS